MHPLCLQRHVMGVRFIFNVKTFSCVISNNEWMTLFTANTNLILILLTTINKKVSMTRKLSFSKILLFI